MGWRNASGMPWHRSGIYNLLNCIVTGKTDQSAAGAAYDALVNQLLILMDGLQETHNTIVVGMTNRKELLDTALLRPGRYGTFLFHSSTCVCVPFHYLCLCSIPVPVSVFIPVPVSVFHSSTCVCVPFQYLCLCSIPVPVSVFHSSTCVCVPFQYLCLCSFQYLCLCSIPVPVSVFHSSTCVCVPFQYLCLCSIPVPVSVFHPSVRVSVPSQCTCVSFLFQCLCLNFHSSICVLFHSIMSFSLLPLPLPLTLPPCPGLKSRLRWVCQTRRGVGRYLRSILAPCVPAACWPVTSSWPVWLQTPLVSVELRSLAWSGLHRPMHWRDT